MELTLNQVYKILNDVALTVPLNKSYGTGSLDNINENGNTLYPLIWTNVQPSQFVNDMVIQINMNIYCMDQLFQDNSNEKEIDSDTMQILSYYIKAIENYLLTQGKVTNIKYNQQLVPFTDQFTDYVSGWYTTVSFLIPLNYCI